MKETLKRLDERKERRVQSVYKGHTILLKGQASDLLLSELVAAVGVSPNEGAFIPSISKLDKDGVPEQEILVQDYEDHEDLQNGLMEADRETFRFATSRCVARDVCSIDPNFLRKNMDRPLAAIPLSGYVQLGHAVFMGTTRTVEVKFT